MTTNPKDDVVSIDLEKRYGPLTIGKMIWATREGQELSQAELARQLRIPRQRLCDFEKGRRLPSPSQAYQIAIRLGLHPTMLVQQLLQELLEREKLTLKVSVA